MYKYHRIRWQDSDLKELEKAVKNFNAKINRISKKNPQLERMLPEKMEVANLKNIINTRQDLNREINALKRFTNRKNTITINENGTFEGIVTIPNNDNNTQITKWQYNEINRRIGIINRKRKNRLKELQETEQKDRDKKLGYTLGQLGMGKMSEVSLTPMKGFTRTMGKYEVDRRYRSTLRQSQSNYFSKQDYRVKENYIKGLMENYDYENIKDVIEHIEQLDIKDFMKTFNEHGATFEDVSPDGKLDLKFQEYKSYEDLLRSTWLESSDISSQEIIISNK